MLRARTRSAGQLIQRWNERFEFDVHGRCARAIARLVHRADVVLELLVRIGRRARDHERGETSVTLFMLEQANADDEYLPCQRFNTVAER